MKEISYNKIGKILKDKKSTIFWTKRDGKEVWY